MEYHSEDHDMEPEEAVAWLTPETRGTLGRMFDQKTEIVELWLNTMPFGSRATLEDLGMVEQDPNNKKYILTAKGWDVARIASSENEI